MTLGAVELEHGGLYVRNAPDGVITKILEAALELEFDVEEGDLPAYKIQILSMSSEYENGVKLIALPFELSKDEMLAVEREFTAYVLGLEATQQTSKIESHWFYANERVDLLGYKSITLQEARGNGDVTLTGETPINLAAEVGFGTHISEKTDLIISIGASFQPFEVSDDNIEESAAHADFYARSSLEFQSGDSVTLEYKEESLLDLTNDSGAVGGNKNKSGIYLRYKVAF